MRTSDKDIKSDEFSITIEIREAILINIEIQEAILINIKIQGALLMLINIEIQEAILLTNIEIRAVNEYSSLGRRVDFC